MIAKESRNQVALDKFLDAHPHLREETRDLSPKEQQQQFQWAFEDEAENLGIEPWELTLQLVAETPEELKAMRLEVHREVAEALGMDWDEYCSFNEITED
ncbi:hypothetical protein HX870_19765 [Pseudomonas gingeri]|uniref:DNA repair ATPase n=1 Tax=Pseudomonas gingeri TaxID=117681 RepID=A0A7Y7XJW7_9PSED|nr:DUF6388 family protein [Pseudomonas gingeri]NWA27769.1 hypothetical protein [Pseudomonas gingeri]NWC00229.1 hypothetical protein [Pseudomonas gingeri]NWD69838.1 hypothetical protein [Pseudomonas gingeri]NWD78140.1 hypothetical protein [Pseudomonas gingeri]